MKRIREITVNNKSVFDIDCDNLKRRLGRLEARRLRGERVASEIMMDVELLEMLIEDHDELLRMRPR